MEEKKNAMQTGYVFEFYNLEKPDERFIGATVTYLENCKNKLLHEIKNKSGKRSVNAKLREFAESVPEDKWVIKELERIEFKKGDRCKLRELLKLAIRKHRPSLNKRFLPNRTQCPHCGKEMLIRSLPKHIETTCPVRKQASFKDTKLYKGVN